MLHQCFLTFFKSDPKRRNGKTSATQREKSYNYLILLKLNENLIFFTYNNLATQIWVATHRLRSTLLHTTLAAACRDKYFGYIAQANWPKTVQASIGITCRLIVLTIVPRIGRKMVAVAVFEVTSVKPHNRESVIRTITNVGTDSRVVSCSPSHSDKPESCEKE